MIFYEDLRALSAEGVDKHLYRTGAAAASGGGGSSQLMPAAGEKGVLLTAWQIAELGTERFAAAQLDVMATVPDFLNYARLLSTGQAKQVIALAGGAKRSTLAGLEALPAPLLSPAGAARQDFWVVAEALLRFDLALLPRSFEGPVLLHPYLADFAFMFERRGLLEYLFRGKRKGRAGVHTQQVPVALSCLARWNLRPAAFSFMLSPGDGEARAALTFARQPWGIFEGCRWIGEVESMPADIQHSTRVLDMSASFGDLQGLLVAAAGPESAPVAGVGAEEI